MHAVVEKSKATSNAITSIVTEDGQQIKDQTSLSAEQNNKAVVPKKSKHIWKDTNCKNVHHITVYILYAIDRST